ncbi:MAG: hypothetical protein R3195_03370 [Gemmatimonadota bacterium]|nr:hypothetical protein [Gemmatimonadota bacterium]
MMESAAARPDIVEEPQGTVFDIGYQSYDGPREGRGRARLAVFKDGVRAALGLGRGGKAKILPWSIIALMTGIGFLLAPNAGAALLLGGPDAAATIPSHSDFYGITSIFMLVFAATVAPGLLCPDRRDGVINLYLVRPLTGTDYIAARWFAFFAVSLLAAWLPQLVLLVGRVMGNPDPTGYAAENWLDLPRILLAGAAIAAYTTTLAMLVAAYSSRVAYAAVFLVGLFAISAPFAAGLSTELDGTAGQVLALFVLNNIPVHVNDLIFGEISEITGELPASELPGGILLGWYTLWVVVPATLLWARYRRLSP